MKKFPAVWLYGLAAMLLTGIFYFLLMGEEDWETMHYLTLSAILASELITTLYVWSAKGNPRKLVAATISVLLIPYTLILSLIFLGTASEDVGKYLIWFFIGFVCVNMMSFTFTRFDSNRTDENNRLQDAKGNMLNMRKIVMCVMADPAARPYEAKLRALEEKLHFSKDNVIAVEDSMIYRLLLELQENIANPEFDTEQHIQELEKIITRRNIMA